MATPTDTFEFVVENAASIFTYLGQTELKESGSKGWKFMREFIVIGHTRFEVTAWIRYLADSNTVEIRGMVVSEREDTRTTRPPS